MPLVHGDFQFYLDALAHGLEMPETQPEMFAVSEIYTRPVHLYSVNERACFCSLAFTSRFRPFC